MTAAPEPLVRLAQYIERRIAELALEYAEVCRRAGISDETLGKIRKGTKARGSTYRKLERALDWTEGGIAAILAGGEPTPLEEVAPKASVEVAPSSVTADSTQEARDEATAAAIRSILAGLDPESQDRVMGRLLAGLDPGARERLLRLLGFAPPRPPREPGEPEGKRHAG